MVVVAGDLFFLVVPLAWPLTCLVVVVDMFEQVLEWRMGKERTEGAARHGDGECTNINAQSGEIFSSTTLLWTASLAGVCARPIKRLA